MENMSMSDIEFDSSGRPFITRRAVGYASGFRRYFGEIRKCKMCGREFFCQTSRKERVGECCSTKCIHQDISLKDYKDVGRIPYHGVGSWAYVAGFFDGEGNVAMYSQGTHSGVRISMYQKPIAVINEIRAFLLSEGIKTGLSPKKSGVNGLQFSNQYAVYKFIMKVQNHCIVKLDELWDARAFLWKRIHRIRDLKEGEEA